MKGRHFDMIVDNQRKVRAQLTIITDD